MSDNAKIWKRIADQNRREGDQKAAREAEQQYRKTIRDGYKNRGNR